MHHVVKEFYVIQKLDSPENFKYFVCPEADTPEEKHINIEYQTISSTWFSDLPDGTLLFISSNTHDKFIIRLDRNLEQHTSIGGRMFALDAGNINKILLSEQIKSLNDAQFRYDVFFKEITNIANLGMP